MTTDSRDDGPFIEVKGNRRAQPVEPPFNLASAPSEPLELFRKWLDRAVEAEVLQPNGMILSTVGVDGRPSARVVLLRRVSSAGFVFYTNRESRKGVELTTNAYGALTFWWERLERQVRVEGEVVRLSEAESAEYFATRPRGSQIGAWASPQSRALEDRDELTERVREMEQRFADEVVPLPPFWGGYRLQPHRIEFWQGRPSRLHDRICYLLTDGSWAIERLAP